MGVLSAKGRAVPSGDSGQEYENFYKRMLLLIQEIAVDALKFGWRGNWY